MTPDREPTRDAPTLSVVVPVHNAPENLARALAGLEASTAEHELVLVDDASDDERTLELLREARESGRARVVRLDVNGGPAVGRNRGSREATGEVLVFIDSDVVVEPQTLAKFRDLFRDEPDVEAAFGSYDDRPACKGVVTEYRNLLHHYVHTTGPSDATTFWTGCGAIRKATFERHGGFDEERYDRPAIEDIELGMRVVAGGGRIRLDPTIRCKHLKRWSLVEMVKVDVTCRAIPWTRLLIDRPGTGGDLNLESKQKACVALVFLALGALVLGPLAALLDARVPPALGPAVAAVCLVPVLAINRGLYAVFWRHGGPLFFVAGIALHLFYFLYAGLAFLWVHATHRRAEPRPSAS